MSLARRVVLSAVLSVLAIAPATAVAHDHAARHSLRAAGDRPELLLRHGRPLPERRPRPTTTAACRRARTTGSPASTRRARAGTTAATSRACAASSTTSRASGTTAIWLTPSFKNKAVQDNNGFPSAGYHGYWITDFTQIDPHLGTNDDLRGAHRDAHARGIKVYFDIITNHTADVIRYREGAAHGVHAPRTSRRTAPPPARRSTTATTPARTRSRRSPTGSPRARHPAAQSFPYHPCVPTAEQNVKVPAWLNDVSLYHNRGNTTFAGENSQYGDFFGLDDLFTENPRVVDGMIDIYKTWIRDFRIDGFRIDTMKHVDDEFWQRFAPAIEQLRASAGHPRLLHVRRGRRGLSRPITSHYTTHDDVQGVLDFLFQDGGARLRRQVARRPTRCATSSSTTTGTPTATRTSTTCRPSSATTTAGGSACSSATPTRARPRPSCSRATASRTR